jgi:hypothetical protein
MAGEQQVIERNEVSADLARNPKVFYTDWKAKISILYGSI